MNSYWIDSTKNMDKSAPIDNDYIVDVCIIGAGICGLSTAYYLAKKGKNVIVIDKNLIGEKTSGHTTAKITSGHGLIYKYLIDSYGIEFARGYYDANEKAIENIKQIVDEENIKCDFEYQPNYIYTINKNEIEKIKDEVDSINDLDKDKAEFVTALDVPFETRGAIKMKDQAQFHPRKYMYGLAKSITQNGGLIFTNSVVKVVKRENKEYVTYTNNYKIKSKYVVLTTHYPFINSPGFYFSKMYQVTSYAIAIEDNNNFFEGMYITSNEPSLSFRTAIDGDKRLLIIGGGNHKTGYSPDSEDTFGYKYIEKEAKKLYPDCNILYKWNTRDCVTLDKIPYIGQFSSLMPNMYVATGFNKWGMTSSNVAANIIADGIIGIDNRYASIFNSKRFKPIKNREELKHMGKQIIHSFITSRIKIPEKDLSAIKNDNGGIIRVEGIPIGIYKDKNGNIYAVEPTCTHLGCLLTWNNIDKTWDCPCHGSRFDYNGKNIYEPAVEDLPKYDLEK